jgi:hypothetical protein
MNADGRRFDIYGRSEQEVKQKYLQAQQELKTPNSASLILLSGNTVRSGWNAFGAYSAQHLERIFSCGP